MEVTRRTFAGLASALGLNLYPFLGARANEAGSSRRRDVNLIVPFPPGAGSDAVARLLGRHMSESDGWTITTSNVSGGNGVIAAQRLITSTRPDDVLMFTTTNLLSFVPVLAPETLKLEPEHDLQPLATIGLQKFLLVAASTFDAAWLLGKSSQAGKMHKIVRFGAVGSASVLHFHSRVLASVLRKSLDIIPYRGMADLMQAMLSGQIELCIVDELTAQRLQGSAQVQLLATMSSAPGELFPSVPLWRDMGFLPLDMDLLFLLFAHPRMSSARIAQLTSSVMALGQRLDFKDGVRQIGMKPMVLVGNEARKFVQESVARDRAYIQKFNSVI